jgi:hypothetical protein
MPILKIRVTNPVQGFVPQRKLCWGASTGASLRGWGRYLCTVCILAYIREKLPRAIHQPTCLRLNAIAPNYTTYIKQPRRTACMQAATWTEKRIISLDLPKSPHHVICSAAALPETFLCQLVDQNEIYTLSSSSLVLRRSGISMRLGFIHLSNKPHDYMKMRWAHLCTIMFQAPLLTVLSIHQWYNHAVLRPSKYSRCRHHHIYNTMDKEYSQ